MLIRSLVRGLLIALPWLPMVVTADFSPMPDIEVPQMEGAGLVMMADEDLGDVTGQALFWSDRIGGNSLTGSITGTGCGAGAENGCSPTAFTFYRMGMDGKLELNMNISKFQLGCGGVNDALNFGVGCDIDIDYLSLMGRTGDRPAGYGNPASNAGLDSSAVLTRPYIELAIKNDNTSTLREVVGLKIGAGFVDGAMSIGRTYAFNERNMENFNAGYTNSTVGSGDNNSPPPNGSGHCNPSAPFGNYQLTCHSGINSFSGFLGTELSAALPVRTRVNVAGIMIGLSGTGCVGRLTNPGGVGCAGGYSNAPLYLDLEGTRLNSLLLTHAEVDFNGTGLASIMDAIYAQLYADLRVLHFATIQSGDFFISFQRERVAYPSAAKIPLWQQVPAGNPQWDACGIGAGRPARCNSAYSSTTNTGWWMNVPVAKLRDINPPEINFGDLTLGEALSLLGAPGLRVNNARFDLLTTKNCYGGASAVFC